MTDFGSAPQDVAVSSPSHGPGAPGTSPAAPGGWYLLLPILLVALGLRALGLDGQSLSMDELTELTIGRLPVREILVARDGFPPLYHTILHGWLSVFPGDLAARWLSVILGTLSIWAVWGFARRAGGDRIALWAALLVAVMPFHIWHSQDARSYILYYLLAAIALWSLFTAVATDSRLAWSAYVTAASAGLLTHYYFALVVLIGLVIVVIERRERRQRHRAIIAHAVLAVGSLPVLWLLRGDLSSEAAMRFAIKVHPAAIGYALFSFLTGYAIGPSPRELHDLPAGRAIIAAAPWLLLTAAASGMLLFQGLRRLGVRRWTVFLILGTIGPVVVCALAADLLGVTFQVRHVLWASIPLMVVLGAGASQARASRSAALSVAALLLLFGVSRYNRLRLPDYQTEDLRSVGRYLQDKDRSAPVLVLTGYMAGPVRHYLPDGWKVYPVPGVGSSGAGLPAAVRFADSTAPSGSPFWLVYTREFHGDPGGRFLDSLRRARALQQKAEFPGVVLYSGGGRHSPP
jgi:Dolichyl-phosphate-mannose-protein mannosyltransferase